MGSMSVAAFMRMSSNLAEANADFPQWADLEAVPRPDERRRSIFLDHGWAACGEAGRQRIARKDGCGHKSMPAEMYAPFARALLRRLRPWQAFEIGPLLAREGRQMQRLDLDRGICIRMAVASLVIAMK